MMSVTTRTTLRSALLLLTVVSGVAVMGGNAEAQTGGGGGAGYCYLAFAGTPNTRFAVQRSLCDQESGEMSIEVCVQQFNDVTELWEDVCCKTEQNVDCNSSSPIEMECTAGSVTYEFTLDVVGSGKKYASPGCDHLEVEMNSNTYS